MGIFNITRPGFDTNAMSVLRDLRKHSDFSDVTLGCTDSGRRYIQAHKFVLSANSPVFKEMFKNQSKVAVPFIYLKNVSFEDLSSLLDFIYCGEVKVLESNLSDFLALAQEFEIRGLDQNLAHSAMKASNKATQNTKRETMDSLRPGSYSNMKNGLKYPTIKSIQDSMKDEIYDDDKDELAQKIFPTKYSSSYKNSTFSETLKTNQKYHKISELMGEEDDTAQALAYQGIDLFPVKEELKDEEIIKKYPIEIEGEDFEEEEERKVVRKPRVKFDDPNKSDRRKKCKICRIMKIPKN